MNTWSRRIVAPLPGLAPTPSGSHAVLAREAVAATVGTLKVQRHGTHGRPVILIPGLQVWQRAIEWLQRNRVAHALTLAGFDRVPVPAGDDQPFDCADALLLANAPKAKVASISPSRHFAMLDQPAEFEQLLDGFPETL